MNRPYRGRIAPSPTGFLHAGHARTFLCAQQTAREADGQLILRVEDLDPDRCRAEFMEAMLEDLRWAGLEWDEGPYFQSERKEWYIEVWTRLWVAGLIYPCSCSRKDLQQAAGAPHKEDDEPIYPGPCREVESMRDREGVAWRFRVPDGEVVAFEDGNMGPQRLVAGRDFGDFVIWRRDDVPAYQLAVVTDDLAMRITEVVRGEDLLRSTARQILLYRAIGLPAPAFYHCPLVTDENGARLAKRSDALSLRALRARGVDPASLAVGS